MLRELELLIARSKFHKTWTACQSEMLYAEATEKFTAEVFSKVTNEHTTTTTTTTTSSALNSQKTDTALRDPCTSRVLRLLRS